MKLVFGVVSLLVALAVVGLIARQQMHGAASIGATPAGAAASLPAAGNGNVAERSRQLQDQVASDVQKALQSGMQRNEQSERRNDEADK